MSWASRRRSAYAGGVILFFVVVVGFPIAYWYFSIPATCTDGKQNQGETGKDTGGPCILLDTQNLSPSSILWARSFRVRDGSYNSVAYVQNPNEGAGVVRAPYRFGLYDDKNVLVAEKKGTAFLMPGAVTPVFAGRSETGNRIVSRTYLEFTEPLRWERLVDVSRVIKVSDINTSEQEGLPRVTAMALNSSVGIVRDITFVISVFDPAGNAFTTSQTAIPQLAPGEKKQIIFTWPEEFRIAVGRIDIIPLVRPEPVEL